MATINQVTVNGATYDLAVNAENIEGLGSAAYTDSTAYDAAGTAQTKADAALNSAKSYADSAATKVKNDLLNGAGAAYDTLSELGALIDDNQDAIEALETIAASKANASDLTSHTGNTTVHITSTERTNWNDANSKKHTHSNKTVLDNTTASFTTEEKTKLSGIDTGANKYTHPSYTAKSSGLYKVTVDSTGHVSAATAVAKSDITGLGIPAQDTTYSNFVKSGSGAKAGLVPAPSTTAGTTKYLREDGTWTTPPDTNTTYSAMTAATSSAAGKAGLVPAPAAGKQASFLRGDGTWVVPTDTKYTHPTYTAKSSGLYKVTVDGTGHVSATTAVAKSDITALGIPAQDTTYSAATTSKAGLMSAADKTKLNGVPTFSLSGTTLTITTS